MIQGDKVTYIPFTGAEASLHQKGIVKRCEEHGVFVVFNCNDDWDNFTDYVAQLCHYDNIKLGWE
jgi:hypothetical protein